MTTARTDRRAILDVAQLKTAMDITKSTEDDYLEDLLRGISANIETYLSRDVARTQHTSEKVDGDGTDTLLLVPHLIDVATIVNDTTTVASDDFEWYADDGEIVLTDGTVFTKGRKKITITWVSGWEHNEVPADLQMAASLWCQHVYNKQKKDQISILSVSAGDESTSYISGMPRDVREMLQPYRVRRYA